MAYVGNLDFDATDSEVQQIFPDCNVTKVRLHTDRHTGKSRGFAHVHFLDEESIDRYACQHCMLHCWHLGMVEASLLALMCRSCVRVILVRAGMAFALVCDPDATKVSLL